MFKCFLSQRKQQKDLLAALQKVVVPIYCTSFLAVEEEKQQKITRVINSLHIQGPVQMCKCLSAKRLFFLILPSQLLQLWEKNGYFDEETIQQLQNPALGLGQYQVSGLSVRLKCPVSVRTNVFSYFSAVSQTDMHQLLI